MMTSSEIEEMPLHEKVILWVLGRLGELAERGLVCRVDKRTNLKSKDQLGLLPPGVAIYDQLKATGFVPPREHVRDCLHALNSQSPETALVDLILLEESATASGVDK